MTKDQIINFIRENQRSYTKVVNFLNKNNILFFEGKDLGSSFSLFVKIDEKNTFLEYYSPVSPFKYDFFLVYSGVRLIEDIYENIENLEHDIAQSKQQMLILKTMTEVEWDDG